MMVVCCVAGCGLLVGGVVDPGHRSGSSHAVQMPLYEDPIDDRRVSPMKAGRKGLVYSTEQGRMCPRCARSVASCSCKTAGPLQASQGVVRVRRETKGRRGQGVTLVEGVALDPPALADLARQLKRRCGSGGTVKHGVIEIQGDHRDTLAEEIARRGWSVKRVGG